MSRISALCAAAGTVVVLMSLIGGCTASEGLLGTRVVRKPSVADLATEDQIATVAPDVAACQAFASEVRAVADSTATALETFDSDPASTIARLSAARAGLQEVEKGWPAPEQQGAASLSKGLESLISGVRKGTASGRVDVSVVRAASSQFEVTLAELGGGCPKAVPPSPANVPSR